MKFSLGVCVAALLAAPSFSRDAPVAIATWAPPRACAVIAGGVPLRATGPTADVLLAEFERGWPRDWSRRSALRNQPFTSTRLRAVVTDLACLSALPGGERIVARTARPLFQSRRHGTTAFEQLDEVARGAAVDPGVRAAARTFHAQMRYEVDMPRLE